MSRIGTLLSSAIFGCLFTAAPAASEPPALKTTEFGNGPAVVLVHDLGAARMTWMPVAKKLMGRHHVVMVDLPGHGESPMPDPFSFQVAADALDGVVARQKDGAVLVGHGAGAVVALLEASAHPERVKGLVVVNAAVRSPMEVPDQQRRQFQQYIEEHYDDFLKLTFRGIARDSVQGVTVHAQAMLVPPENMKLYFRELLSLDAGGAAKKLAMPLLFVGSGKVWTPDLDWPALAKKFGYEEVKKASGLRIASAGNFLYLDSPDSLALAIEGFTGKPAGEK